MGKWVRFAERGGGRYAGADAASAAHVLGGGKKSMHKYVGQLVVMKWVRFAEGVVDKYEMSRDLFGRSSDQPRRI